MKMRMSRLKHLTVFSVAAIHLLLFSVCQVSGRIYRTNDAVVIEADNLMGPTSSFASRNFGYPPPIPMMYAVNPYTGLYYQQQPNFPFWPYPLYRPASSFSDVKNITATSAESKQQKIACGVGPTTLPKTMNAPAADRILGGTEATPNSWPFVVGLKSTMSLIYCGGSIISKTRILTAASCVYRLTMEEISQLYVLLIVHRQAEMVGFIGDAQMVRRVLRVVYHIDYNAKTLQNDVAVLTIDPPINFSKDVSPVCLPPASSAADQFVGKDAAIMGWGVTEKDGSTSKTLQQATVQVTANAKCSEGWSASPSPVSNQHICASAAGKDICKSDNGGPMVAQTKDGSTSWTQVGIASFGNACAGGKPIVFANVAFFRKWIDTYVRN